MHSYEHYSRQELLEKIEELETTIKQLSSGSPLQKEEDFSLPLHVAQEKNIHLYKKENSYKFLDALPDMLSVLDREGNYIDLVSAEKTVHVGESSAHMIGKNIREILPPDAYSIIKANLEQAIATQAPSVSHHTLNINNENHFFENRMLPLEDRNVLCICRDITEAIKTQDELQMLKSVINNSVEEIYASTTEGELIFANSQFRKHYSLKEEFYPYKIYEIYPGSNKAQWERFVSQLKRLQRPFTYHSTHLNKENKIVSLEITSYIIKNLAGKEIVWTFAHDTSETKQQQKRIRELNYIMDTILNNIPVYLFVKDTGNEFRYLYWNKAFEEHSHIPASKVLGKTDEEIFPCKEDALKFKKDDLRLLKEGQKIEFQEEYLSASGEKRIVNTIKTLVPSEDKPPLIIGISWDITDLKNTEKELIEARIKAEESDKLKSAFLANMSHEIRTPLNAIVGFSKLIAESDDPADKQQYYDIIDKNTDLLLQLINDILDLSKIEAGTLEFVQKPVNLRELCLNLYDIHHPRTSPDVQLIYEDNFSDILTISDNNRLSQVLSNLLTNAQKFTRKGEIRFGFEVKEKNIEFYVKDTGIGISQENIKNIFNRFIKLNTFVQGSGLGLAICNTIIENLGGRIWGESTEGKGSVFRFLIPYHSIPEKEEKSKENTDFRQKETAGNQKTILIAEDVDSNYLLLQALLQKKFRLIRAINGLEVIDMFQRQSPDLILMDIKMPEMDGLEATRRIRQQSTIVPIIALTAFAFESDKNEAIKAGCDDFLTKPLSSENLKQVLEKYI